VIAALAPLVTLVTSTALPAQDPRPAEYWRAIVAAGHAVPEGESPYELIVELSVHLGSRDSVLRDDCGYGIPVNWIYQRRLLQPEELRGLVALWTANLERGLGEVDTDSVLLRSFSALDLSLLAAHDNDAPFLDPDEFASLLEAGLAYLGAERDLRGWVEGIGWVHATAHTADLLKFLARSRHLDPAGQRRILDAIAARMASTAGHVYVFGEDERLAAAVLSLLAREDQDPEAFEAFLNQLATTARAHAAADGFDPVRYAALQNSKNLLRALHVRLTAAGPGSPALADAGRAVLGTLGRL
jgi:hypothetical protein